MQLALSDLFRAKWTNRIHDEWIRNLLFKRPDFKRAQLEKTRQLMNLAARDCLVEGYDALIAFITLPDEDDRHVLAAAIHSEASVIVTFNLKDFPVKALKPYGVKAIHPDDFVLSLLELDSAAVCEAVQTHRARLKNPPKSVDEYLLTLENQGLLKSVVRLRREIR